MQVHLHIGAHKTATTFMQGRLEKRRAALEALGVRVVPHGEIRRNVSDRLDLAARLGSPGLSIAQSALGRAMRPLTAATEGMSRLILSDENLMGSMSSVTSDHGMYPQAAARLKPVLAHLAEHDAKVFLAVRAYPDFLSSIYAYQAGRKGSADVEAFRRSAATLRRGWPDVAGEVCEVVGADRVTVWTYESFAADASPISDALTGEPGLDLFAANGERRLPSLSRKGMAVMDRVSGLLSDDERRRLSRVIARFAFDEPDGKFHVFEGAQAEELTARYVSDLAAIKAMGCRVVGFPAAVGAL